MTSHVFLYDLLSLFLFTNSALLPPSVTFFAGSLYSTSLITTSHPSSLFLKDIVFCVFINGSNGRMKSLVKGGLYRNGAFIPRPGQKMLATNFQIEWYHRENIEYDTRNSKTKTRGKVFPRAIRFIIVSNIVPCICSSLSLIRIILSKELPLPNVEFVTKLDVLWRIPLPRASE